MTKNEKVAFITYFGCTVAPGGSYGAPVHAVRPFGASLAASVLSRIGDPGNAGKHRTLGGLLPGGHEKDRIRSRNGVAEVARLQTSGDLYRANDQIIRNS